MPFFTIRRIPPCLNAQSLFIKQPSITAKPSLVRYPRYAKEQWSCTANRHQTTYYGRVNMAERKTQQKGSVVDRPLSKGKSEVRMSGKGCLSGLDTRGS